MGRLQCVGSMRYGCERDGEASRCGLPRAVGGVAARGAAEFEGGLAGECGLHGRLFWMAPAGARGLG